MCISNHYYRPAQHWTKYPTQSTATAHKIPNNKQHQIFGSFTITPSLNLMVSCYPLFYEEGNDGGDHPTHIVIPRYRDDTTKRIRVLSSWGSFYTFAIGKERKNDRQDPVHLCVGNTPTAFLITWILRYTQNDTKRMRFVYPPPHRANSRSATPPQGRGWKSSHIPLHRAPRNADAFCGWLSEGGTTEWWGGSKSIRVKIAKARAHCIGVWFYPLQENQGFFATHFFIKMKKFFGGFPPFFNFANCPKVVAKKPWFFYDVHE